MRSRRGLWVVLGAVVVLVIGAGVAIAVAVTAAQAPHRGSAFLVPAESSAALASESGTDAERAAAAYLAAEPTAYWLTPERDPIGGVGERIAQLAAEAQAQSASLALVIYGLPERDCGNHSAGGLDQADYDTWTTEIAVAIESARVAVAVILEPDSLALATECGNLAARVPQLQRVIDKLQSPQTWIYLDGGHSNWHPAAETARLLQQVGLDKVRGFTLNVSNFNASADEVAYAHAVARAVGGGVHALIDTSRNGAGSNGEWCNPAGRSVGEPSGSFGDDVVDTNLWIKPPGESDGPCNGGPAAGVWWPAAAVELTRSAID